MKKVYQTIFGKEKGNCYSAALASLLELELGDVPHFVLYDDWAERTKAFMLSRGYEQGNFLVNARRRGATEYTDYHLPDVLPVEGSIHSFYDAVVFSPNHFDLKEYEETNTSAYHAVICDRYYNIVHDPAPEYAGVTYPQADIVGKNGIVGVEFWLKKKNDK